MAYLSQKMYLKYRFRPLVEAYHRTLNGLPEKLRADRTSTVSHRWGAKPLRVQYKGPGDKAGSSCDDGAVSGFGALNVIRLSTASEAL